MKIHKDAPKRKEKKKMSQEWISWARCFPIYGDRSRYSNKCWVCLCCSLCISGLLSYYPEHFSLILFLFTWTYDDRWSFSLNGIRWQTKEKRKEKNRRTHGDLHICWKNGAHADWAYGYRWARKRIGIKKCVDLKQTQLDINVLNDMIYGEHCAENAFWPQRIFMCLLWYIMDLAVVWMNFKKNKWTSGRLRPLSFIRIILIFVINWMSLTLEIKHFSHYYNFRNELNISTSIFQHFKIYNQFIVSHWKYIYMFHFHTVITLMFRNIAQRSAQKIPSRVFINCEFFQCFFFLFPSISFYSIRFYWSSNHHNVTGKSTNMN